MPRGVDEVQNRALPVDPHVLGLNGDAPLTLEVHGVEVLGAHVSHLNGIGELQNTVGKGGLTVVDVGND